MDHATDMKSSVKPLENKVVGISLGRVPYLIRCEPCGWENEVRGAGGRSCTKREEIRITNTGSVCVSNLSPTIRITARECKTKFGFGIRVDSGILV